MDQVIEALMVNTKVPAALLPAGLHMVPAGLHMVRDGMHMVRDGMHMVPAGHFRSTQSSGRLGVNDAVRIVMLIDSWRCADSSSVYSRVREWNEGPTASQRPPHASCSSCTTHAAAAAVWGGAPPLTRHWWQLVKVLQLGHIWGMNIGESPNISADGWWVHHPAACAVCTTQHAACTIQLPVLRVS